MIAELLAGLEASAPAQALRNSVWVYPLVNAAHVCGVGLLIGAIVPLDCRLLGAWRDVPLVPLWRVLTRSAILGLALAVVSGAMLFSARATEYVTEGLFLGKLAAIGIGIANALALRAIVPRGFPETVREHAGLPRGVRAAAAISLIAWLVALVLGRLVGYF